MNNKIRIGIVEDESIIAASIYDSLKELGYDPLEPVVSYGQAIELLEEEHIDLLLIDIQLAGKKTGIDLAKKIQESYKIPFIILSSNVHSEYLDELKKLNQPTFLSKPYRKKDLHASIEIILHDTVFAKSDGHTPSHWFIKQDGHYLKLELSDISYLKSDGHYIDFFTSSNKRFTARGSLADFEDMLLKANFVRTHRSYIVNSASIMSIHATHLIVNNIEIPLTKSHRKEILYKADILT